MDINDGGLEPTNEIRLNDGKEYKPKFMTKDFLDAVEKSSIRTRKILILIIFSSLLVLMALVNSLDARFNWILSRSEMHNKIDRYFYFKDVNADRPANAINGFKTLTEFIRVNESKFRTDSAFLEHYLKTEVSEIDEEIVSIKSNLVNVAKEPSFQERSLIYQDISKSFNFLKSHNLTTKADFKQSMNALSAAQLEHINFVKVPILGISFDINYLGFYSGLGIFVLSWLLQAALKREYVNIKIAFKRELSDRDNHSYYFYEYMTMLQVLSMPRKLFSPWSKWNSFKQNGISAIPLALPLLVYSFVLANDAFSFSKAFELNPSLTIYSFAAEIFFFLLILWEFILILIQWRKMDYIWDTQVIEYNFEFILECVGSDEINLMEFAEEIKLTEKDIPMLQIAWFYTLQRIKSKPKGTSRRSFNLFSKYIKNILKGKLAPSGNDKLDMKVVENSWNALVAWFRTDGKKSIAEGYGKSFHKMCMRTNMS